MSNSAPPLTVRNVLFIMADQLRWDYLSCAGHPRLQTPNLDALAARAACASPTPSCRAPYAALRECPPTPAAT